MLTLLLVAFISGLLTILAPCIWPILPVVLSTSTTGGHRRPFGVSLGILLSFTVLTLSLSYLVSIFHFDPNILRLMAVFVLVILGLVLLLPRLSAFLEGYTSRLTSLLPIRDSGSGFWSGLLTGLSLGVVWAPCAGPILATIAALSATRTVTSQVVLITVVYMLGTGIPLFLFATFGSRLLLQSRSLSPFLGRIQQIFGLIMILTALSIYSGYDRLIQTKLLDILPGYSNLLYRLEQTPSVQEQLNRLSGRENSSPVPQKSFLPDLGMAPEFKGLNQWLNSSPLTQTDLRDKVVLVDFWTYSCINCLRTLPFVSGWAAKYRDQGLVVVGVHTPEFEFEKNTQNVQKALSLYHISYPVALDNSYSTWNNFRNSYWPAKYLIDKDGHLRYKHFGEGNYPETEKAIQTLLAEAGRPISTEVLSLPDTTPKIRLTPETYLGKNRSEKFSPAFTLGGTWNVEGEFAESTAGSTLDLDFFASRVFLVITPQNSEDSILVFLDGKPIENKFVGQDVRDGRLILDSSRLYEIIDLKGLPGSHLLQLKFETTGTKVFAFTFG